MKLARALALWLPLAAGIAGVFLFSYWAVQQNYRLAFNDLQIQAAEDGAGRLAAGEAPAALTRDQGTVDLRASLGLWVAVYDASGTPLESTGVLDGAPPRLPAGVFDPSTWRLQNAERRGGQLETRFTWQPTSDVRQAVTLVEYQGANGTGFVAAGRNMREVEGRIIFLTHGAAMLWGATELGTLIIIILIIALGWL